MDTRHTTPRHDQDAPNLTPSQASTNSDDSDLVRTHQSDLHGRSRTSLHSVRSVRDKSMFVTEIDGRKYNITSDLYALPADQAEWDRLNKQHYAFVLGFGSLYPLAISDTVASVLAPGTGSAKAVLDLGYGSGLWSLDVSASFPQASLIGVDLAFSAIEEETAPQTCRFELDNVNLGLSHFWDQFDFVNARGLSPGAFLCLLPGGIALFGEVDWTVYNDDRVTPVLMASEANSEGSWLQRILHEAKEAASQNGSDLAEVGVTLSEGLWTNDNVDPESCGTASIFFPIGPCREALQKSKRIEKIATLMTENMKMLCRSLQRLLIENGVTQEEIDTWLSGVDHELETCKEVRWIRFDFAWGRRKGDGESPPPENLPPPPKPTSHPVYTDGELKEIISILEVEPEPYPYLFVYNSLEESSQAAKIRKAAKGTS